MKRILYHGTSVKGIKGMMKEKKIIPQKIMGSDAMGSPEDYSEQEYCGYIFLTDEIWLAGDYSSLARGNSSESGYGEVQIILALEVEEKNLLPDVHDAKKAKTWKESLKQSHQVKIKGPLDIKMCKKVLLGNYQTGEIVLETTLEQWEKEYKKNKKHFE